MKKAMDISPTHIVVAIILLLIILVVLIYIMSDQTGAFIFDIEKLRQMIWNQSNQNI